MKQANRSCGKPLPLLLRITTWVVVFTQVMALCPEALTRWTAAAAEAAAPVVTIAVVIAPGVAVGALEPVRRRRVRPAERAQDGEALGGGGTLPREIRRKRRRPARDDRPEDEKETLHLRAFCLRRGLVAGGAAPTFPFASR